MEHIRSHTKLSLERLKECLLYEPETGVFTWLVSHGTAKAGAFAGGVHKPTGYRLIRVDGIKYRTARLAWLYMKHAWPNGEVDHKDLDNTNDRWVNLRDATTSQNTANRILPPNAAGHKGVRRHGSGWQARITKDKKVISLGVFSTAALAADAYEKAAINLFGEFARTWPMADVSDRERRAG